MAHTPVTVIPCSLHNIAVVTDIIASDKYFHPKKIQKEKKEFVKKIVHLHFKVIICFRFKQKKKKIK